MQIHYLVSIISVRSILRGFTEGCYSLPFSTYILLMPMVVPVQKSSCRCIQGRCMGYVQEKAHKEEMTACRYKLWKCGHLLPYVCATVIGLERQI